MPEIRDDLVGLDGERTAITTHIHDAIKDRGAESAEALLRRERYQQLNKLHQNIGLIHRKRGNLGQALGQYTETSELLADPRMPYWQHLDDLKRRIQVGDLLQTELDNHPIRYEKDQNYSWRGRRPTSQQQKQEMLKIIDDEMRVLTDAWKRDVYRPAPEGSLSLVPTEGAQGAVSLTDLNPGEVEALTHQQEMDRYISDTLRDMQAVQPSQADIARISAPTNLGGTAPTPRESERPLPQQISQTAADLTVPPPQKEMGPEDYKRIEADFFGSPLEELDEGVLSSYKFLQLVEQTLYEANTERSSFDAVSHQANLGPIGHPQWNDQAAEDAIYDNDDHEGRIKHVAEGEEEELEEMSSMAGGNVAGYAGKRDDEPNGSLIREEDDDEGLVENIVNYLNSEVGVI